MSRSDYQDFLSRLARLLPECEVNCFAWSLMPNHLHLLLRSGMQGVSKLMQRLLGGYAGAFNLRYKRVGHLFQNRFKSIICETEPYFLELIRYIHLNPVRAYLIKTMEDLRKYPWTGHPAVMGDVNLNWQSTSEVLMQWNENPLVARQRYEEFLRAGFNQGERPDLEGGGLIRSLGGISNVIQARLKNEPQLADLRILGSGQFVEQVLSDFEDPLPLTQRPDLEEIIRQVSAISRLESAELFSGSRVRRVSEAKALLIQQGVELAGLPLQRMAELTRMTSSAATRALRRAKSKTWGT